MNLTREQQIRLAKPCDACGETMPCDAQWDDSTPTGRRTICRRCWIEAHGTTDGTHDHDYSSYYEEDPGG